MAITVPVDGDLISANGFGAPVANQLNSLVPTVWTGVTFASGFSNLSGFQTCQYRKVGDQVYIRGVFQSVNAITANNEVVWGNVPAGFGPPVVLILASVCGSGGVTAFARVDIRADGSMSVRPGMALNAGANSIGAGFTWSTSV